MAAHTHHPGTPVDTAFQRRDGLCNAEKTNTGSHEPVRHNPEAAVTDDVNDAIKGTSQAGLKGCARHAAGRKYNAVSLSGMVAIPHLPVKRGLSRSRRHKPIQSVDKAIVKQSNAFTTITEQSAHPSVPTIFSPRGPRSFQRPSSYPAQ